MKIYTPSLILYFTSCIIFVALTAIGLSDISIYPKAIVIPAIVFYYVIKTKYRIDVLAILAFALAFAGDIYILMGFENSLEVSIVCFMGVYLILLSYVLRDFAKLRFRKWDTVMVIVVAALLAFLLINVLSLQFDEFEKSLDLFTAYGIILGVLSLFASANYIANGNYAFLNLVILVICFIVSDLFYALNRFYLQLPIFESIAVSGQVASYLFMARYYAYRKPDGLTQKFEIDLWNQERHETLKKKSS